MKSQLAKLLMLCLLFTFSSAHCEIYSWVDKDGKKHFGEEVPKQYQKQSKTIEAKPVNSIPAPAVIPPAQTNKRTAPVFVSNDSPPNTNSCEQQKRAYEESVMCYASCKNNGNGGGRVNNVSACGKCQDLKKPSCE
jgi:hypothetical protein